MSASQNDAAGVAGADAIGLQLLMGGGFADALAAAEATLGGVQRAAERALGGLALVQAAGNSLAAVPPVVADPDEAAVGSPVAGMAAPAIAAPAGLTVSAGPTTAGPAAWDAADGVPADAPAYAPLPAAAATSAPVNAPAPAAPSRMALASFAPSGAGGAATRDYADDADAPDIDPPTDRTPVAQMAEQRVPSVRDRRSSAPVPTSPAAFAPDVATPMRAMAPPPAAGASGGPTGGDVFLDGTRMGTWVADHLAREAGRPQAGGTGFDSRLTAAWPGTLQGG